MQENIICISDSVLINITTIQNDHLNDARVLSKQDGEIHK